MKKYTQDNKLDKIICNKCGRELNVEKQIPKEGVLSVRTAWGYFSKKDGQIHSFDLCEDCYDQWIKTFAVPVEKEEDTELLGI